jgi:hypothetical protein
VTFLTQAPKGLPGVPGQRAFAVGLCVLAVSGCMQDLGGGLGQRGDVLSSTKTSSGGLASLLQGGQQTDDKFERAPDLFRESGIVRWNGQGTVSGVWAAHPDVDAPRRVRMVNTQSGLEVDGMLYRVDATGPQDAITVSSAAAEALELRPNDPTLISLFGLRSRSQRDAESELTAEDLKVPPEVTARNELVTHVGKMNETEITELVAAAMRGMGYDTRVEADAFVVEPEEPIAGGDLPGGNAEETPTEPKLTVVGAPPLSLTEAAPDPGLATTIDLAELNRALTRSSTTDRPETEADETGARGEDDFSGFIQILAVPKPGAAAALTPIRVTLRSEPGGPVEASDIKSIQARLTNLGEIGVVVSVPGFTEDAVQGLTLGMAHLEMVDLDGLLGLWTVNYDLLEASDRALLPLQPVYFLAKG